MSHNDTLAAVGAAFIALNDCDNDVRALREQLALALDKRQRLREALSDAKRNVFVQTGAGRPGATVDYN